MDYKRLLTWNWVTEVLFKPANHGRQCRKSPRAISNAFRCHSHKLVACGLAWQVGQQELASILLSVAQIVRDPVTVTYTDNYSHNDIIQQTLQQSCTN